jgi:2-dehydropantoate 2-reductase
MKFAIFGAGAVGGYFGGRLALSGQKVIFIARGRNLDALRKTGLSVVSVDGDFTVSTVAATDSPTDVGPVDIVLVTVKTWQLADAIQSMAPLVGPETVLVPLLNGVDAPKVLSKSFGNSRVVIGMAKIIARLTGPAHVHHLGAMPFIALGEPDNRRSRRVERLKATLSASGITTEIPGDIHAALWSKFLFVVSWGGVGAVTRAPIGVLRSMPQTREMIMAAMEEIYRLALSLGIGLTENIVASTMAFIDSLPPEGTASLQRDIAAGLPSELESWNGAVERLGREAGVATPVNAFIYRCLLPLEKRATGELNFR